MVANLRDAILRCPKWLILGGLVFAHAGFNAAFFPYDFDHSPLTGVCLAIIYGVIAIQPLLFATWAVLGPGNNVARVFLAIPAWLLVALSGGLAQLNVVQKTGFHDRMEFMLSVVSGLAILVAASTILPMLNARQRRIIVSSLGDQEVRLTFVHRILNYSVCMLLIAGALFTVIMKLRFDGARNLDGFAIMGLVGGTIFALLALSPILAICLLALSPSPDPRSKRKVIVTWGIVTLGLFAVVFALDPDETSVIALIMIVFVQLGAAAAGMATVLLLRLAGYRLIALTEDSSDPIVVVS